MSQIQDIRIQQKVDTKAMWETNNPQLLDKEIGYEKETGRYKIGELNEEKEQKHWNELPYAQNFQKGSGENSILQAKINDTWSKSQTLYLTKNEMPEKILHEGDNILVDAAGINSVVLNGESQAVGKYATAEGKFNIAHGNMSHTEGMGVAAIANMSHAEGYCSMATGLAAHSEGDSTLAEGLCSHTEGWKSKATAPYSHAEGANTTVNGQAAHAEGNNTTANGSQAHAEGNGTKAVADQAHAEGLDTQATATAAHAENYNTIASGTYSHAEGYTTKATGQAAHAEGRANEANGAASHVEGGFNKVTGQYAHAEGYYTQALSDMQHVQGQFNIPDNTGKYAHIVGWGSSSGNRNIHTLTTEGEAWYLGDVLVGSNKEKLATETFVKQAGIFVGKTVENTTGGEIFNDYTNNMATDFAHAEGYKTKALGSGAHSEGSETQAPGQAAHAEGTNTKAEGHSSHAEGIDTVASSYSHAEGFGTISTGGMGAHSEGHKAQALGEVSHAEGMGTIAKSNYQHVQGKFNLIDSTGEYAHIVGWGESEYERKNIHTLATSGDAWFAGNITVGANKNKVPTYRYGAEDIGEGAALETGVLYFVYE